MNLHQSIILTLGYTAQFCQPLSAESIYKRLIYQTKNHLSLHQLAKTLALLVKQGVLVENKGLYTLRGFEKCFLRFAKRYQQSQAYWIQTTKIIEFLKKIPWISGVAITGSLAVNNSLAQDDIDLMIITKPNACGSVEFWSLSILLL